MPEAKSTLSPTTLTEAQRARRDRIVDAGLALLGERDFDKIQVKDVAEEANVALGTLYHYFSSKEHLFAEVLIRWAATLRTNISRNPLRGPTDAQRLTQVINRSVRAFQRQPSLARLVATLETSSDGTGMDARVTLPLLRQGEEAISATVSREAAPVKLVLSRLWE